MSAKARLQSLQRTIWEGSLPLEIRLDSVESRVFDQSLPYYVQHPRLSYLPELLGSLRRFFQGDLIDTTVNAEDGWFSLENVPLKWHYSVGLLYDVFSGAVAHRNSQKDDASIQSTSREQKLPWRLTVHFSNWPDDVLVRLDAEGKVLHDAYINSVKEADFLRNGTAKNIMSLSKEDSTLLWTAVREHNFDDFTNVQRKLLNLKGMPLRHAPVKIYLPRSSSSSESTAGHVRVVQLPVTPRQAQTEEPQTIGTMMHSLFPSLFPNTHTTSLALPIIHGAVLPMDARVEELLHVAAYSDGWLHIGVEMT